MTSWQRQFRRLWAAYAVSTVGTWLAFDAFSLVAIIALGAGPGEVSLLAAAGLAVGAILALPLGPWVEFRRKRPVMVAMDLLRFAALASIPLAYALGRLSFAQLLAVSVIVGAADIAFRAASGAFLKSLLPPAELLRANGRFEATNWTATMLGPPLGGAAIGLLGPVATLLADAASYLLSALTLGAIRGGEARPPRPEPSGRPGGELLEGWRYLLAHPTLRPLFLNSILVKALILATAPLLAVLMIGQLGFAPWQYGLAFAAPCLGGLLGARLSSPLVARLGERRVLLGAGTLRTLFPIGLAVVGAGAAGLALVIVLQLGLVTFMGIYVPVLATHRLEQTAPDRVARVLSAWAVAGNATTALLTVLWGLLASATSPRLAIGAAGALVLATPLLLPGESGTLLTTLLRRGRRPRPGEPEILIERHNVGMPVAVEVSEGNRGGSHATGERAGSESR